jgi:hypothetical protein
VAKKKKNKPAVKRIVTATPKGKVSKHSQKVSKRNKSPRKVKKAAKPSTSKKAKKTKKVVVTKSSSKSKKNTSSAKKNKKRAVTKKTTKRTYKKSGKKATKKKVVVPVVETKEGAGFSSNNFNGIRSLLWKNHKEDFKSYFDPEFIRKVNSVYNDCKAFGSDCTEEIILLRYRDIRENEKRPEPFIDPALFEPQLYFYIKDIEFTTFAPYLWIVSPMIIPSPSEFLVVNYFDKLGDSSKGYYKYFSEWVDWCNDAMANQHGSSFGSGDIEMCFRFLPPKYDDILRRWDTEVVICTPSGQIFDFGYTPVGSIKEHDTEEEFIEPDANTLLNKPTTEEESNQMEKLRKQKANTALQNAIIELHEKLKKEYKKQKEEQLRIDLQILQEVKEKTKSLRANLRELEKTAATLKKIGDKKGLKQVSKQILEVAQEISKNARRLFKK